MATLTPKILADGQLRTKIYYMADADGEVRYVGKTSRPFKQRCLDHLKECRQKSKGFHRLYWLRKLQREGFTPLLHLIEEVEGAGSERERYWIQHYRSLGCRLVNSTDGGEGVPGLKFSPEAIEKNRQSHIGRVPWNKGKKMSAATCRKMSESKKGKPPSNKGKPRSAEVKKKLSVALTGRAISKETRGKLSESLRGHLVSETTRRKISEKLTGEGNGMFGVKGKEHPTYGKALVRGASSQIVRGAQRTSSVE
jgi:hypothetical protein